jgi:hypothetical protein
MYLFNELQTHDLQPVPELPPHRKQTCAYSERDSKMTKINFPVAQIKFSISPIPEVRPQVLLKNRTGCWTAKIIINISTIREKFTWNFEF